MTHPSANRIGVACAFRWSLFVFDGHGSFGDREVGGWATSLDESLDQLRKLYEVIGDRSAFACVTIADSPFSVYVSRDGMWHLTLTSDAEQAMGVAA